MEGYEKLQESLLYEKEGLSVGPGLYRLDKAQRNNTVAYPWAPTVRIQNFGALLTENLEVTVSFYNENPISIELPNQVNCKIETTDVALKGQTVSSSYKPATLDNGLSIQVPPFIEAGDEVIVDTRNLEYVKKI